MPLRENQRPCWEATCDECGEGDNGDSGGSYHYESRADAIKELEGYGWKITDERLLCEECAERADG